MRKYSIWCPATPNGAGSTTKACTSAQSQSHRQGQGQGQGRRGQSSCLPGLGPLLSLHRVDILPCVCIVVQLCLCLCLFVFVSMYMSLWLCLCVSISVSIAALRMFLQKVDLCVVCLSSTGREGASYSETFAFLALSLSMSLPLSAFTSMPRPGAAS